MVLPVADIVVHAAQTQIPNCLFAQKPDFITRDREPSNRILSAQHFIVAQNTAKFNRKYLETAFHVVAGNYKRIDPDLTAHAISDDGVRIRRRLVQDHQDIDVRNTGNHVATNRAAVEDTGEQVVAQNRGEPAAYSVNRGLVFRWKRHCIFFFEILFA